MNRIVQRLRNEPAVIVGVIQAVVALVVTRLFTLDLPQVGAVMAWTAIGSSLVVREIVTGPVTASRLNVTGDAEDQRIADEATP